MIQEYSVEDITVAAICPKIFVNGIDDYIRIVKLPNVVSNRLLSFLKTPDVERKVNDGHVIKLRRSSFSMPCSYRIYSSFTAHAVSQF
jgi:hypothetical protein